MQKILLLVCLMKCYVHMMWDCKYLPVLIACGFENIKTLVNSENKNNNL